MRTLTDINTMEKVLKINFWRRHAFLYASNQARLDVICSFECTNIRLDLLDSDIQICFKGHESCCGVLTTSGAINMDFVDRIVLDFNTCGVIGAAC
ncbi:hypothetical protein V7O61_02455 [Methanolobus sp. WCC1]|jgi:hypothetical protein|uniref:hypothetical protein n=1 Tax=unclassified Methanolobus TaxID=2629569 RepID=UPI0032481B8C